MMYGWDRADLLSGLLHGDAIVSTGIIPDGLKYWYDPNVQRYTYDPVKARALLDAAGWRVGSDGVRSRGGKRLSFELKLPNGSNINNDLAAEFQADMLAIGIAISVKDVDYGTFIDDTNSFNYELALTGWGGTTDPDEFTFLNSSQIVPVGNNDTGYRDKIVDYDTAIVKPMTVG